MELKTKAYKPFTKDEVSIRRDVVFRMVFGDNYRSEYLKELLESLLHKKITNIVIRNDVAIDKVHGDDKTMRLDILAEIDGKEKVNVEFQNKNEYNVIERGEVYGSGIYYNSVKLGDKYVQATKTIVIWILGFNLFKDSNNYHEIGRTRRESDNKLISDNIEYHYIQLPKFIETVKEIRTPEEQWLAYLSHSLSKEEEGELFKMNRSIEEINKIVDIVMTEQDVRDALNDRILAENLEYLKKKKAYEDGEEHGIAQGREEGRAEGRAEGREEGIAQGRAEGQEQEKAEIAKKMLSKNMDDETIMEITKISEEELKQLKNMQQR